jgi:hypothetical protein
MKCNPRLQAHSSRFHIRRYRALPAVLALVLAAIGSVAALRSMAAELQPVSFPEEIEWTWEVRPPHPDPKLPNVLLLGDSISRNYFPQVGKDLAGIANVYLMASSTSVGDPRLPHQIAEFAAMENEHFRVVHFNNGMHGWAYSEAQYRAAFPGFLRSVHSLLGKDGALIWANTTPVKAGAENGATNSRIDQRNAIAQTIVEAVGIPIDDQHALMMKHLDLYLDSVHFNPVGAGIQGDQAATTIRAALPK